MAERNRKLHILLPKKLEYIRQMETTANSHWLYNFSCKTERFKLNIVLWFTFYTCIILNWLIRMSLFELLLVR